MKKDLEKVCEMIWEEIDKIADKGLTTGNLETAYKLIDMYKDIKTVEGMEDYSEDNYSQSRGRGAKRDGMGRYSRAYDSGYDDGNSYESRYLASKRAYRNTHSNTSKQDMLSNLDDYMNEIHNNLKEMRRDTDTPEEREMIEMYMKKFEK